LYYKVLFMSVQNTHLDTLQDIRKMMQRSSRFISLSGLSGMAAGTWALIGAYIANDWMNDYYNEYQDHGSFTGTSFQQLKWNLFLLAFAVLTLAIISAFYFTWRKASRDNITMWDHSMKLLTINLLIPLITGGLFILSMLQQNDWHFIAPACLIFYGLALVNGSRYTLTDIRYLGYTEIVVGLINTQFPRSGLYFWAIGFGILHIIYGFVMWWKYERKPNTPND
jgi:magnesium-transporting ATPase (P-type)